MNNTPKIAYIVSRFPKVTETFILREILELEKQDTNVYIYPLLNFKENIEHDEYVSISSNISYTPFLSVPIIFANLRHLFADPLKYLGLIKSIICGYINSPKLLLGALSIFPKCGYIADTLKQKRIDHIHAHFSTYPALAALIISQFSEIKFSFTVHAFDIFLSRNMLCEKLAKSEFVISISDYNKKYLLGLYPGLLPQKIKVIHCGIEKKNYSSSISKKNRELAVEQYNISNDDFLILSVASLQKHKGLDYLIRACSLLTKQIPGFKCLIVGEGKQRDALQLLIDQLKLHDNITLVGSLKQNEVARLLKISNLFVLPSIVGKDGRKEGIPVSLMEAMGTGLPVISSDISGVSELIEDNKNGILTKPGDYKKISDSIMHIFKNPDLGNKMGSAGLKKVEDEFDLKVNVQKIRRLFADTIDQGNSAAISITNLESVVKNSLGTKYNQFNLKKIKSGYDSNIFELSFNNAYKHKDNLILKLYRPTKVSSDERFIKAKEYANREYNTLLNLYDEFSLISDFYTVPKPIEHYPDIAAVLMEKCPGVRLDSQIKWISIKNDKDKLNMLVESFTNCGKWLGNFHAITKKEILPDQVYSRIKSEFYVDLDYCKKFGLNRNLIDKLNEYIKSNEYVFSGEHSVVGHHCDFAPYNVFVSKNSLSVIDFEGITDGLIYDDLTYFLAKIEATNFYHLNKNGRNMLKDSFLKGYSSINQIDTNDLNYFKIISMVKQMSRNPVFRDSNISFKSKLLSHWKCRFYNSWFTENLNMI